MVLINLFNKFYIDFYLKLTKKVPVIFDNLRGYDGHLIMQEISLFDVEIHGFYN